MISFLWAAAFFAGGLIVGWFLLPAPRFIDSWWHKHVADNTATNVRLKK